MSKSNEEVRTDSICGPLPSPWSISQIKPKLHVYRRNKPSITISHDMSHEDAVQELLKAEMLPTPRFIFITHGFLCTMKKKWLHDMKDEMINKEDQTVTIVGWGEGANQYCYKQAAANTQAVGSWLAEYVKAIKEKVESPNTDSNIYIWGIGHSLGAHLMGKAGRTSKISDQPIFDRITGLDPAGAVFQIENHDKRLTKTDAKFVDVIHTDGKAKKVSLYYGTLIPLGTIDFYPNFGWSQPTKGTPKAKSLPKNDGISGLGADGVSHKRAHEYFIWSISNRHKFKTNLVLDESPRVDKIFHGAYPNVTSVHKVKWVATTAEMGYYADKVKSINPGNYYVKTNASDPWL